MVVVKVLKKEVVIRIEKTEHMKEYQERREEIVKKAKERLSQIQKNVLKVEKEKVVLSHLQSIIIGVRSMIR